MSARADVALHLLAQLPDRVRLQAEAHVVARAYGVEDRTDGERVDLDRPFAELADELGNAEPASTRRGDDTLLAGQRFAVITNLPMHYRVPLFAAVNERVAAAGGSVRVLFLAPADKRRPWVPDAPLTFDHAFLRAGRLTEALRSLEPTVVIAGGFSPVAVQASLYARRRRIPLGIWTGSVDLPGRESSALRRFQRRWLLGRASFGLAYGIGAREYLRGLAPALPVVIVRNTSVAAVAPSPRLEGGPLELLALGQLTPHKGIDVLIDALRLRPGLDCRLTVVGNGPERARLTAAAAGDERIVFTGAIAPGDTRAAYERAQVFAFPTRQDVFGHVLTEAMSAGLPVVTTARAGATADLCVDGRNAVVVDGHDPERWAAAIDRLAGDAGLRARLGARASDTVAARWTLGHSADAMVAGLRLGALVS